MKINQQKYLQKNDAKVTKFTQQKFTQKLAQQK